MDRFGRHLAILAITAVLGSALLCTLVTRVDPNGYFGLRTDRFYYPDGRRSKAALVRSRNTSALYFASSLSFTFSPSTIPFADIVNVGDDGLLPEEILYLLEKFGAGKTVAIIGIDPYSSQRPTPLGQPDYADFTVRNVTQNMLSLFMARQSLATLAHEIRGDRPVMGADGDRPAPWETVGTLGEARHHAQADYDNDIYRTHIRTATEDWNRAVDRIPVYRRIRDVLDRHHIKAVVFFQPINEDVLAYLRHNPELYRSWMRVKTEVAAIFPEAIDLSEGELSARENFYTFDAVHYRRSAATKTLSTVWRRAIGPGERR